MIRQKINTHFEDSQVLRQYLDSLPDSFENGGIILWDGRNKIKAFTLDGTSSQGRPQALNMVVKRFKHMSLIQKLGYVFHSHKAHRAFRNGLRLIERGIDTPTPIAYVELRHGLLITDAFYLSSPTGLRSIEGEIDRDDWNRNIARDFAHFVAELHSKGILHHDLNDTNVLYRLARNDSYKFQLIDINRMKFYTNPKSISEHDLIENLTRFTGRMKLFEFVVREYAKVRQLPNTNAFVARAIRQKELHDKRWRQRKAFLAHFKHKKKQK